jgi:hypothetical protein
MVFPASAGQSGTPAPVSSYPVPCETEPLPAAHPVCDPFRYLTRAGGVITGFPRTLLWEPPLASLREPRFLVMPTTLSNTTTQDTVETAIGGTIGFLRLEPAGWRSAIQFDVFGLANSRFADYDYLVGTDYRFGFPISIASGPWHAKIGYEHTSTHLGDETQERTGQVPFDYIKDELVLGLGRYLVDGRWRLYGQMGWAMRQDVPGDPSPFRFALGTEWSRRRMTGWWGQPFAAANLEFDGAVDYDPNLSLQLGWLWRDPDRRLSQFRVFGQYYTGHSPYGQFFLTREDWFGIGAAVDY